QRSPWQVSLRAENGAIEWASHAAEISPHQAAWQLLQPSQSRLHIDSASTFRQANGIYQLQFDHQGHVSDRLGRLTLKGPQPRMRRCVVVSTLLGALRKGRERPGADGCG
ncbi:MAG: prepilin-type cleavage/methylation domain-containing protein, partial [Elainellaceae cyanobacterium]